MSIWRSTMTRIINKIFFFSRIFMLLSPHEDAERFSTVKMNPITNKITRSYEHLTIEFSDEEKLTVNHLNKHLSLSKDGTGTAFKVEGSRWIGQRLTLRFSKFYELPSKYKNNLWNKLSSKLRYNLRSEINLSLVLLRKYSLLITLLIIFLVNLILIFLSGSIQRLLISLLIKLLTINIFISGH